MPDLTFLVQGVEPVLYAAAPLLSFRTLVTNRIAGERVHSGMLRCRVVLEPAARDHDPGERERLRDLFDRPERWGRTVRPLPWAEVALYVPSFVGSVDLEVPVPCSGDLELAATRYLFAVRGGDVGVGLTFRGTVLHDGDSGLRAAIVAQDEASRTRLPVSTWAEMMGHYFPNSGWLRVRADLHERLSAFKVRRGLATPEQAWNACCKPRKGAREMAISAIEQVARAILYEGYVLYPYRPSSVKNRQRWTVGAVYPESFCLGRDGPDASAVRAECLLEGDDATAVDVKAGFLQLVAGGGRDGDWREAVERQVVAPGLVVADLLGAARSLPFAFSTPGGEAVRGVVEVAAARAGDRLFRVSVEIVNTSPFPASGATTHADVQPHALTSAHAILGLRGGRFVSSIDPGERLRDAASGCRNAGLWPVLAGEEGSRSAMLAAPIILYDYPRVAPESHGDLFDATEIDEILTLRILTLTGPEKREMAALDPRTRALLRRTEALGEDQLLDLHGAMSRPGPSPGDRVILRPKGRADAFDLMLAGQAATVATIERDFEDRVYVTVLVDDDPGKDLGAEGKPGHRFFFREDEVEPLDRAEGGTP